jgi:hypothetical protein
MRAPLPLAVCTSLGILSFATACTAPPAKTACAVIDLANTACHLVVRLEDGRTVEIPKESVKAAAHAALAPSASASPSKP